MFASICNAKLPANRVLLAYRDKGLSPGWWAEDVADLLAASASPSPSAETAFESVGDMAHSVGLLDVVPDSSSPTGFRLTDEHIAQLKHAHRVFTLMQSTASHDRA